MALKSSQESYVELSRTITGYMGKRMSYEVAINFLIAVEPDIANLRKSEQKRLVDDEYAPDRVMSYRIQGGELKPFGFVDIPDSPLSTARKDLEKLIDALPQPDWLYRGGGGGGGPIELIDPEVLAAFLAMVKDVAQEFMKPILVGVAIQQVTQYLQYRRDAKQEEQDKEIRVLSDRIVELEAKLSHHDSEIEEGNYQVTSRHDSHINAANVAEDKSEAT